jgi:HAD superfamily hydrolase (TIGR01509 family)
VIFDCDGVLVDSEPLSTTVLAAALSAVGLPTSPGQAHDEYRGMLLKDIAERVEDRLGAPLPAGFWQRFERARAAAFETWLRPVPGARQAVHIVKAAGMRVCVASQGKPEKTELTLGLTGLRELFGEHALFSAYSVPRGKPHPDLFLHAADMMGAVAEDCVVVEDTTIGARAAVAAGMSVIGLARHEDPGPLRDLGATTIRSLNELAPLVSGKPFA